MSSTSRPGPAGAHQITNRTDDVVRYILTSAQGTLEIVEYPNSGKIAALARADSQLGRPLFSIHRLADAVDYWEGESAR